MAEKILLQIIMSNLQGLVKSIRDIMWQDTPVRHRLMPAPDIFFQAPACKCVNFRFAIDLCFRYIRSMDSQIRNAAFILLEEQTNIHGDVLPREILNKGFNFMGQRDSHRLQNKRSEIANFA